MIHQSRHCGRGNETARFQVRATSQVQNERCSTEQSWNQVDCTTLGNTHLLLHRHHDGDFVLGIIILDFPYLTHLEAIDRDGSRLKQSLGAFQLSIVMVGRRQQIDAFQVINSPIKQYQSQQDSKRDFDILGEKLHFSEYMFSTFLNDKINILFYNQWSF